MRISVQKVLTVLGISILVSVLVSVLTFRSTESSSDVSLDFPPVLVLQIRDESKVSTLTFAVTDSGRIWFLIPKELVIADSPRRITTNDLANGILTDAVRNSFSTLFRYEEVDVWQLEANALAAFVEVIGGYEMDNQQLNGNEAVEFLSIGTEGDSLRFRSLWRSIVKNLDAGELSDILPNLGSTSRSNRPIEKLISYFGSMQATFQMKPITIRKVKTIQGSVNGRIGLYLTEKSRLAIIKSIEEGKQ
jgi:hypothetical protein